MERTPSEKRKFIVAGDEPDVAMAKTTNPVHHLFHGKGGLLAKLKGGDFIAGHRRYSRAKVKVVNAITGPFVTELHE